MATTTRAGQRPLQSQQVTFAVVMPAFNEAADISLALRSLLQQTLPPDEVIVVDDGSSDNTAAEAVRAGGPRVRVIQHDINRGAAAARNSGIRAATSDVVVFLDADDMIPSDFLERIAILFGQGAEFVQVESHMASSANAVARFHEAEHRLWHARASPGAIGFTAAFSCRRQIALEVTFPEELPGCGGEDGEFFERLRRAGYSGCADYTLVVERNMPWDIRGFVRQGIARGKPVPYVETALRGLTLRQTTARRMAAAMMMIVRFVVIVPAVREVVAMTRISQHGRSDVLAFWTLYHVRTMSRRAGEWQSLWALWRRRETAGVSRAREQ